jgi:signal peptidase I
MSINRRVARAAALGACAALLIVAGYFLAPRQLGGRASYVTTTGTSMEPVLSEGDLAVVYRNAEYQVGDVVAYRNPDIQQVVLHRIVAVDGGRFVLQGDNNSWLDTYRPAPEQILGEMGFHLPGVGGRLGAVRSPWGLSAMVSLAGLAVFGGRKRRRGKGSEARDASPAAQAREGNGRGPHRSPSWPSALVPVLAGVAILSLAIGAILFSLSPTVRVERDYVYEQAGTFSYTGSIPPEGREVYGRDSIETGDPVYLELTPGIRVTFAYSLSSAQPVDATGTIRLVAEVSDVNGWTRTLELSPKTEFAGVGTAVEGDLDLEAIGDMTSQLERVTGVVRDHYTVAVRADVVVEGTIGGRPVAETFQPELRFFLDALQLQLEPAGAAPLGEEVVDPLAPTSAGLLKAEVTEPRTFSGLGLDLRLEPLRTTALVVFAVAALAWLGVVAHRRLAARRGEAAAIETRYGQFLVPVRPGGSAPVGRTVQVESFDSLLRIANHYGHVVLHEEAEGRHAYSVEENGVTYRYSASNGVRP